MANTKINFYSQDTSYQLRDRTALKDWIKSTITQEDKIAGQISIIICSDEYLLKLNKEYLNHDTFTDIITFDYTEMDVINGDVFISIDRIKENAKELEIGLKTELYRVIIHGVLHLCGYKDKIKSDKFMMQSKEDFYLKQNPLHLK